jgi:DNA-binding XRE family transcriptional regulator
MKKGKTTDAVAIIHKRYYKDKPERLALLNQERVNAKIARDLYKLRIRSKMTQKQLASLVGTTPSVISRLENADYTGHSLSMIQRIAAFLNRKVDVRFVQPVGKRRVPSRAG